MNADTHIHDSGDWILQRAERMDKNGGVALELENVAKRGQHNNGFGTCNCNIDILYLKKSVVYSLILPLRGQ